MLDEKGSLHRLRNSTLLLVSTMTVMAGATIAPSLPDMEKHFSNLEHSTLLVQLVMTIPGLTIALLAPFIGWFLDRQGKKNILLISTFLYGVSGVSGFFFDDSLYGILIGRVFLGVAVAGIMVTCTTLIGDYFDGAKRGKYMGLQAAFGGFGGVLFVVLGTWLASISWQTPFIIYALAFLLLPCLWLYIEEPKLNKLSAPDEKPVVKPIKNNPFVLGCYFLAVVEILALYMVPVHFPFYAQTLGATGHFQMGFGIALMMLVMSCVAIMYRVVQIRASFRFTHSAGIAFLALGFGVLSNVETYLGALIALAISGIGLGLMRPNLVMWLMSFTSPTVRGRVMGGLISCFFIGQFICPLVTYPVLKAVGYNNMFLAVSAILGFLAVLISLYSVRVEIVEKVSSS